MFEESARLVVWLVPIMLLDVIILREYERGLIFGLGKLLGTKGARIDFSHSYRRSQGENGFARRDHRRRASGTHDSR